MPRSEEAETFFFAVYSAVQEIPPGKVTTYGHIAKLIGTRKNYLSPVLSSNEKHDTTERIPTDKKQTVTAERPRQVGICLKHLSTDPSAEFNNETVPWQRVINAKGAISPRSQPSGARSQADALRAEDVQVTQTALGEFEVDFESYGWFPDVLPSEEGEQ
ncbi:mgmt family protein [Colletotrichum truncatum]|uniref:Mgmt family protein n=1 Tax=Colletotrichum truncatum TaxID=5467 RepID=A0ACC3ZBE5_COLTU